MRNETTLAALEAELTANCGDLFEACRTIAVSPMFVSTWRRDDKEVDARITEAERVGAIRLESVAISRAVHGVEKGVYFKGERVDTERQYSDSLLLAIVKARLPERYGKDSESSNTFNGPTQINIMPRADNYDAWLKMKDAETARKALPAPEITQTVEFEDVPSPLAGLGF